MKKKLFATIALTLSTLTLAACSPSNQTLTFSPNWEKTIISEASDATEEELTYLVEHDDTSYSFLHNDYFTVKYCYADGAKKAGVYTTKLEYLKNNTYRYTTTLEVDVTFTLANGESVTKTDTVETEAKFKKADKSLQPLYSRKTVHAHAPRDLDVTVLEDEYDAEGQITKAGAYIEYDYEFAITYNEDLSGGTLVKTDNSERGTLSLQDNRQEINFSIEDDKYTYLDNEQYLFALRGISSEQLASSSKTVSMYNASLMAMEAVTTTPTTAEKTSFELQLNGGEKTSYEIEYVPLTIKSNNKNAVVSQTLWYAKTTDSNNNQFRNVLLKMSVPMHFGLGSLEYTLQSATFSVEG